MGHTRDSSLCTREPWWGWPALTAFAQGSYNKTDGGGKKFGDWTASRFVGKFYRKRLKKQVKIIDIVSGLEYNTDTDTVSVLFVGEIPADKTAVGNQK